MKFNIRKERKRINMSRVLLVRLIAAVCFALGVFAYRKVKGEYSKMLTIVIMGGAIMMIAATL